MRIVNQIKKFNYNFNSNEKPLIVFIHGAGCDQTLWSSQNRYFYNKGFSTVAINLPGHGKNNDKALTTVKSMANYITNVLKKTVHKKFILISHSMGTLISIYLAFNKILNINKMILIGSSLPMKVSSYLLEISRKDQDSAINNMINWSLPGNSGLYGSQIIGMRLQNYLFRVMLRTRKNVLAKDLNACNNFILSDEKLKKIKTPTCLIAGQKDIMTPTSSSIRLSNFLSNSELNIINNCGHFHIFEKPNKVRNIISKFIGA